MYTNRKAGDVTFINMYRQLTPQSCQRDFIVLLS